MKLTKSIRTICCCCLLLLLLITILLWNSSRQVKVKEHFNLMDKLFPGSGSGSGSDQVDPSLITISPPAQPDFSLLALKQPIENTVTKHMSLPPPYPIDPLLPNEAGQRVQTISSQVQNPAPSVHPITGHSIESGQIPPIERIPIPTTFAKDPSGPAIDNRTVPISSLLKESYPTTDIGKQDDDLLKLNTLLQSFIQTNEKVKEPLKNETPKPHEEMKKSGCFFISTDHCPVEYPQDAGMALQNSHCPMEPGKEVNEPELIATLKNGSLQRIHILREGKNNDLNSEIVVSTASKDLYGTLPRLKAKWNVHGGLEDVIILDAGSGMISTPEFRIVSTRESKPCRLCCA